MAAWLDGSVEHPPHRPTWDCLACGRPWPCDPAREHLKAQMPPLSLAMFAWACLEEAAGDLQAVTPTELFERFLAWTRGPLGR